MIKTLVIVLIAIAAAVVFIGPLVRRALLFAPGVAGSEHHLPTERTNTVAKRDVLLSKPSAEHTGKPENEPEEPAPEIDLARIEGRVQDSSMKKVGEIVDKHPTKAVSVLRQWMSS